MKISFDAKNAQGLNERLSELLGHPVSGDWDKEIPTHWDIGGIPKDNSRQVVEGRKGQIWGEKMERYATGYLKKYFENNGWIIQTQVKINGVEYDLFGWQTHKKDVPDLHIEVYFPLPFQEYPSRINNDEKLAKDGNKLQNIGAKHQFFLVGISRGAGIVDAEISKPPNIKVKFQEHKFGKFHMDLKLEILLKRP